MRGLVALAAGVHAVRTFAERVDSEAAVGVALGLAVAAAVARLLRRDPDRGIGNGLAAVVDNPTREHATRLELDGLGALLARLELEAARDRHETLGCHVELQLPGDEAANREAPVPASLGLVGVVSGATPRPALDLGFGHGGPIAPDLALDDAAHAHGEFAEVEVLAALVEDDVSVAPNPVRLVRPETAGLVGWHPKLKAAVVVALRRGRRGLLGPFVVWPGNEKPGFAIDEAERDAGEAFPLEVDDSPGRV